MTTTLRKQFTAQLTVSYNERAVVARISSATVDRDGEVLLSQGCDATEFFKSPAVFFNHDYTQPLGKCVAITRHRDSLEAKTIFAQRPNDHQGSWLPDTMLALFQQGIIKGFSVGFVPVEGRRPTKLDRETYGPLARYIYSKWKLLEYSVAPLPANANALAMAVSKGVVSAQQIHEVFGDVTLPVLTPEPELAPAKRKRVMLLVGKEHKTRVDVATLVHDAVLKKHGRLYA